MRAGCCNRQDEATCCNQCQGRHDRVGGRLLGSFSLAHTICRRQRWLVDAKVLHAGCNPRQAPMEGIVCETVPTQLADCLNLGPLLRAV